MTDLTLPIFTDESKAREHLESIRWANGPFCPHCGEMDNVTRLNGTSKNTRAGLHQCNSCRGAFTVTTGTVMESSHIPLNKWVLAFHLMCASKKGMSALQLQRMLDLKSYRSAWFMAHRVREAMKTGGTGMLGAGGKIVEVDETFIGKKAPESMGITKKGSAAKNAVLTLVERGGESRSFHVENARAKDIAPIIRAHVAPEARIMTDEAKHYIKLGREFAEHGVVNHSKYEYVSRTDRTIHTNTVEGFYSVFKRGMKGVYQHCGEQHLHRYITEFDFRYSNRIRLGIDDEMRTHKAIMGAEGKRLKYR